MSFEAKKFSLMTLLENLLLTSDLPIALAGTGHGSWLGLSTIKSSSQISC